MSPTRNGPCPCGSGNKYKKCCLLSANGSDAPRSSASTRPAPYYLKYMGPQLMMRVDREAKTIAAGFDVMCREAVDHLNEMYVRAASLIRTVDVWSRESGNELDKTCAVILSNALRSLTAAFALLRTGWRLQPYSCLRNALEAVSVAVYLHQHPSDLERFKVGNLNSPKTITSAQACLPGLGKLNGILSNEFVHIGKPFGHNPKGNVYTEDEWEMWQCCASVAYFSMLIYQGAERIFYDSIIEHHWWHREGPGEVRVQQSAEMSRWRSEFSRIYELRAGPLFEAQSPKDTAC
jgi:hypothetical protein